MADDYIIKRLFDLRDTAYREFHSKLMPTVPKETVIGVRTPDLRKLAKELKNTESASEFMKNLPHKYYEENNLHAFLIEEIGDYNECIKELNRFLPFVDNWATCDMMRPKIFKKHLYELLFEIRKWIESDASYTVRFGIECLMLYYLDEYFSVEFHEAVSKIRSDEYYIRMMQAWYFATALAKKYDETVPYLELQKLEEDTHNKTIRKAIESYRITDAQKLYLRTLKR